MRLVNLISIFHFSHSVLHFSLTKDLSLDMYGQWRQKGANGACAPAGSRGTMQWRRDDFCRSAQTFVLPPPIRSILQSGYFHVNQPLRSPLLPSPPLSSSAPTFPFLTSSPPLDVGPLNPTRKSGESCKFPQSLERSPRRN